MELLSVYHCDNQFFKQGRKLSSLKRNKAVTISGNNGLVSGGLMELQTGCAFENKVTTVMWTDYLVVNDNQTTTSYKAVGTAGNEIESVYVKNADSTLGKKLTQGATAAEGVFAVAEPTLPQAPDRDSASKAWTAWLSPISMEKSPLKSALGM